MKKTFFVLPQHVWNLMAADFCRLGVDITQSNYAYNLTQAQFKLPILHNGKSRIELAVVADQDSCRAIGEYIRQKYPEIAVVGCPHSVIVGTMYRLSWYVAHIVGHHMQTA